MKKGGPALRVGRPCRPTTSSTLLWNGGGCILNGLLEFVDRLAEDSHRDALFVLTVDLAFADGKILASVLGFLEIDEICRPAGANHGRVKRSVVCHNILHEVGGW